MPLIEWNESLNVGVEAMDSQHKRWVEIINELDDSLTNTKGPEMLKKIIKDMEDYVEFHFKEEEQLMERVGYPDIEMHKAIHEEFRERVRKLKEAALSGEMALRTQVMIVIKNWFRDHILNEDRKYSKFVYPYHQ